jgi:hypothetical protein
MSMRYDEQPPVEPPRTRDGAVTPCLDPRRMTAGEVRLALSGGARAYALLSLAASATRSYCASVKVDSESLNRELAAIPPETVTRWLGARPGILVLEP